MKPKMSDWWKCSINKQEFKKDKPAKSKIINAVISSDAIQCLQKAGFNVVKIVPYDNSSNTKSINQA
jgi:hypothetical protein